jgi:DNA helicase IV
MLPSRRRAKGSGASDMRLPAFEDLSKEQDLIYNLDLDGNYLVTGPPGTGKSVMALYRAQVLSFDDREPAVLMYNNVLQQYTEQAAGQIEIGGFVTTYHKWLWRFWREHYRGSMPTMTGNSYAPDWPEIWKEFAAKPVSQTVLEDVLVDEGQDLPLDFFRLSRFLAKNMTVFADENQQLWDQNTTIDEIAKAIKPKEQMELKRNYRNTAEIAAVAAKYYSGSPTGIPDPPTRHGEQPTLRHFGNDDELADFIARYVKARTNLTIGIACDSRPLQMRMLRLLDERKLPVPVQTFVSGNKQHSKLDFDSPAVTIVNFKSLKGLEFDTLFVPELQQVTADPTSAATRMLFYVVMSRARDELHLSYSGLGGPPAILDGVKGLVREL